MTISEALQAVSRIYEPGVVHYYAQLTPDPWQSAHSELERVAGVFDDTRSAPACDRFVARCSELITRFKNEGGVSKTVSAVDGFSMTSRETIDAHFSRKLKRCAKCESRINLKIISVHGSATDVFLLCEACASRGAIHEYRA